ncbi:MAG: hypothetical protein OXI73_13825 [Rhodospirillales bacterium]|nr:hypothetical protein [Rhodospirillales bacterium]
MKRRYDVVDGLFLVAVVAGLSLGFWVSLLGPGGRIAESGRRANYETALWRPVLRDAFPHARPLTRRQAHAALDRRADDALETMGKLLRLFGERLEK